MTTDPKLAEVEQAIHLSAEVIDSYRHHDIVTVDKFESFIAARVFPVIRRLLDAKDAEIAALKQPMDCGHPKACWHEDNCEHCENGESTQLIQVEGHEYDEPCAGHCTACEHERLERTAALGEAITPEVMRQFIYGHFTAYEYNWANVVKQFLALIPTSGQSALHAHDSEIRFRFTEQVVSDINIGHSPILGIEHALDALIQKRVAEARLKMYLDGVKDGAEIALRDASIVASQINHEAAVAICDMSSDQCVEQQKGGEKVAELERATETQPAPQEEE